MSRSVEVAEGFVDMRRDAIPENNWPTFRALRTDDGEGIYPGLMSARTITVGLPVRNGAALLDHAIDALVRQTHGDLRILLSDNCSTDATPTYLSQLGRA